MKRSVQFIYLHPQVFKWMSWDQIAYPANTLTMVRRPHEMCSHAESRINTASSDHDLVDAVCALKRAIMLRTKNLRQVYKLKVLPVAAFPKEQFEQLLVLGIIKPLLLSNVLEVRRIVEHLDGPPPTKLRCRELAEFTWYFLKATDPYVSRIFDGMRSVVGGTEKTIGYETYITISPQNDWKIKLDGSLPCDAVSFKPRSGWFGLQADRVYANKDAPPSLRDGDLFFPKFGDHKKELKPDDVRFAGEPDSDFRSFLIREYFAIVA